MKLAPLVAGTMALALVVLTLLEQLVSLYKAQWYKLSTL